MHRITVCAECFFLSSMLQSPSFPIGSGVSYHINIAMRFILLLILVIFLTTYIIAPKICYTDFI